MPKFKPAQRLALKRLDLLDEQIKHLESVLPLCAAVIKPLPPLNEVRDEFELIIRSVEQAESRLKAIARTKQEHFPARFEARQWIHLVAHEADKDLSALLAGTTAGLSQVRDLLERARSRMPASQRRSMAADWRPIDSIARALLDGFTCHYGRSPFPPYPIKVSKGVKSPFRQIVEICYEAVGHPSGNAERAIREYQRRRRSPDKSDD